MNRTHLFHDADVTRFLRRLVSLLTDILLAAPFFLIPLLFSSKGTHTIVIKEVVFQAFTWNLAMLAPIALWLENRTCSRPTLPFLLPALAASLTAWLWISVYVISPHPRSAEAFITWLAYLMFASLAAVLARSPRRFYLCVYATVISSLLVSAYAVLQAFEIDWFYIWGTFSWDDSEVRRVTGSLGNPDYLASYLAAIIPLTVAAAFVQQGGLRVGLAAVLVLQLTAMFFTYSRGGLVALLITLALFAAFGFGSAQRENRDIVRRWINRRVVLGAGAAVIVFALSAGFFAREEVSAWRDRMLGFGRDQAGVTRIHFYQGALTMWMDQPLLGHGLGMFDVKFPQYRPMELGDIMPFREFRVEHAHNEFLQIGAELGLIGLAIYLLLFGFAAGKAIRLSINNNRSWNWLVIGLIFGVIATFIHNLFTVTLRYTPSAFLIWSFVGLAIGRMAYLQPAGQSWRHRLAAPLLLAGAMAAAPFLLHEGARYYAGDWLVQEGKKALAAVSNSTTRNESRSQLEQTLTLLHRGKALTPAQVEVYFYLGVAYNQVVFDYVQAREIFEELEGLYPNFTATRMNLGINAIDQAEMLGSPERLRDLLRGPRGEMPSIQPFMRIAMQPVDRLLQQSRQAIEDDPSEPVYYYLLGRAHFARLEYDEAFDAFEETAVRAVHRSEHVYQHLIAESRTYQQNIELLKEGKARMYISD